MAESEGDRSKKRLAGESVDSGSSSVIGTSSPSIEPHPDDDERETRLFEADVAGLDRRSSRQSRRLGGHGRERPVVSGRTSAAG